MFNLMFCILLIIPLPSEPDWESTDNDYSTGGALVDVDLDGDLDLATGNGNDMQQEQNRVYYNTGDSLEIIASWSSTDIGYNAHISLGDIDYDGYPELAVANYGDPGTPQYDKLYYNQSGTYQLTSAWQPSDLDNSFACAFGDVDGDGDLDLAVACGEEYTDSLQHAKVYLNHNGLIDTIPAWQTNIESYFFDVVWVDIDADGDLDLALAGMHRRNMIYRNSNGMLENSPYWQSANNWGSVHSLASPAAICPNSRSLEKAPISSLPGKPLCDWRLSIAGESFFARLSCGLGRGRSIAVCRILRIGRTA